MTSTLAHRIASALLTPHGGPEGTRLAIKLKRPDGREDDLGGNNTESVIETISRHLDEALRETRAALRAASAHTPAGSNAALLCANALASLDGAAAPATPEPVRFAKRPLDCRSTLHD